jgi:ubiquitin C-terminal hydrolase
MFLQESEVLITQFQSMCPTSSVYIPPLSKLRGVNLSTRFNMDIDNCVKCDGCNSVLKTKESLNGMIQLNFTDKEKHTVEEMLSDYCLMEKLIDSRCSGCNNSDKRFKFSNATLIPSELILHLKRFSYDEVSGLSSKNVSPVSFPAVLNIANCHSFPKILTEAEANLNSSTINMYTNHCNSGLFESLPSSFSNPALFYDGADDVLPFSKNAIQYQLTGVILHDGGEFQRMNEGHYVADTFDNSRAISKWKRCNDSSCTDTKLVSIIIIIIFKLVY